MRAADDLRHAARAGDRGQERRRIGAEPRQLDPELAAGFPFAVAALDEPRHRLVGAAGDLADMLDMGDLGRRLYHSDLPDAG